MVTVGTRHVMFTREWLSRFKSLGLRSCQILGINLLQSLATHRKGATEFGDVTMTAIRLN